jgi:hypothetical protein
MWRLPGKVPEVAGARSESATGTLMAQERARLPDGGSQVRLGSGHAEGRRWPRSFLLAASWRE